jgi:hypothetical protein
VGIYLLSFGILYNPSSVDAQVHLLSEDSRLPRTMPATNVLKADKTSKSEPGVILMNLSAFLALRVCRMSITRTFLPFLPSGMKKLQTLVAYLSQCLGVGSGSTSLHLNWDVPHPPVSWPTRELAQGPSCGHDRLQKKIPGKIGFYGPKDCVVRQTIL